MLYTDGQGHETLFGLQTQSSVNQASVVPMNKVPECGRKAVC